MLPDSITYPEEIVYGIYELDGAVRGHDRWWIQRLVESEEGWMVHHDIYLDAPTPRYITVDVEMSETWQWLYLNLRDDAGNLLAAEVTEAGLVIEQNGAVQQLPFNDNDELDYFSPFCLALALHHRPLLQNLPSPRRVTTFDLLTFTPHQFDLTLSRMAPIADFAVGGEMVEAESVIVYRGGDEPLIVYTRADGLVYWYPGRGRLAADRDASAGRGRMPAL